jgi:aldehyde dehydrogenase (NAD+)
VYAGGKTDAIDRYIEPTILTNLDRSKAKVMQEEIFGPLLPVFRFSQLDEVISYVNEGEKPLTMYIFARNSKVINRLQQEVPSGSIVTNDCLFQFANHFAPFGGVGFSGMGGYRGKFSFEAFSQKRSILRRDDHKFLDIPIR